MGSTLRSPWSCKSAISPSSTVRASNIKMTTPYLGSPWPEISTSNIQGLAWMGRTFPTSAHRTWLLTPDPPTKTALLGAAPGARTVNKHGQPAEDDLLGAAVGPSSFSTRQATGKYEAVRVVLTAAARWRPSANSSCLHPRRAWLVATVGQNNRGHHLPRCQTTRPPKHAPDSVESQRNVVNAQLDAARWGRPCN